MSYNIDAVVYRRVVVPAKNAPDGETESAYIVTREVSGYALWYTSCDCGDVFLKFFHERGSRELATEEAVERVKAYLK